MALLARPERPQADVKPHFETAPFVRKDEPVISPSKSSVMARPPLSRNDLLVAHQGLT